VADLTAATALLPCTQYRYQTVTNVDLKSFPIGRPAGNAYTGSIFGVSSDGHLGFTNKLSSFIKKTQCIKLA